MRFSLAEIGDRRTFFRTGARAGFLCLLAIAAMIAGRTRSGRQRCLNRGICGNCAVLADCGLPQALSAKQAQAGG
jgi:hypothetical protein